MALMTLERWKRFLQMYLHLHVQRYSFFPPLAPMCASLGVSNLPLCRATRLSSTWIKHSYHTGKVLKKNCTTLFIVLHIDDAKSFLFIEK